jgi:hypothetical protein
MLLVALPVSLARAPRQYCKACRMADLPLPFGPDIKLTCSLNSTLKLAWHMKFVTWTRLICPAPLFLSCVLIFAPKRSTCQARTVGAGKHQTKFEVHHPVAIQQQCRTTSLRAHRVHTMGSSVADLCDLRLFCNLRTIPCLLGSGSPIAFACISSWLFILVVFRSTF